MGGEGECLLRVTHFLACELCPKAYGDQGHNGTKDVMAITCHDRYIQTTTAIVRRSRYKDRDVDSTIGSVGSRIGGNLHDLSVT